MLEGRKLFIVTKEGQIAVMQTDASRPPFQHWTAAHMKLRRIRCSRGIYDARKPHENRFCIVNPIWYCESLLA